MERELVLGGKNLYLVETTTGDKWEILGGNYLIWATSEEEVRGLKFTNEKIERVILVSEKLFTDGKGMDISLYPKIWCSLNRWELSYPCLLHHQSFSPICIMETLSNLSFVESVEINISVGYCPECGQLNIWKDCRKCVGGCGWTGEPEELIDTYEEYLNNKRFNKLKETLK